MKIQTPTLQSENLTTASTPSEYALYRAAIEWGLVDPIVIKNRDDLKSESTWKDRVDPFHHQVTNLITFCRRLPVTLLADDVGLGKTISAGLIMSELIARGRITKILIVCPKLLLDQWKEEMDTKFGIQSIIAKGKELVNAKLSEDSYAVITTYHSAKLYLDQIKGSGFDMLILDEAHKLRNLYGTDPTPQVAIRFRQALSERMFKYVLMLTATPIQNRLWDIYSLVDLLTVARGHQNPFGTEGMFARKFIEDSRTQARHLNLKSKDEFRRIVYGYMSRIRRADAKLSFPKRDVQLHKVDPTPEEHELIEVIKGPIQELNPLTQVLILQTLVSSPEALSKTLNKMAVNGTVPLAFASEVNSVVARIHTSAKLNGLGVLIDNLKLNKPENWRVLIFTRFLETQTSIQIFLEQRGVVCGIINGGTTSRNSQTIESFKKDIPDIHVIISTEAGSEGVNLQAANVLVNYDLPWNPMIVEQRIGRVQRLGSKFESVSVLNITLKGTFEEYIVGRLMEKLQMTSHAIGDIESLLEASGINDSEDDNVNGFEDKIRQLVVSSLAGHDTERATELIKQSITRAKVQLEEEKKEIDSLFGKMDEMDNGPICPDLPKPAKSIDVKDFMLRSLEYLGARMLSAQNEKYSYDFNGEYYNFHFNEQNSSENDSLLVTPMLPIFGRIVNRMAGLKVHNVVDIDDELIQKSENLVRGWVNSFSGSFKSLGTYEARRCFEGEAIVLVRATVAHDSYERLVPIEFNDDEFSEQANVGNISRFNGYVNEPQDIAISPEQLVKKAVADTGVEEFCRFYLERHDQEILSAGDDERKRKKLQDDFTPRLEATFVGAKGSISRIIELSCIYSIDDFEYTSKLNIFPSKSKIVSCPVLGTCEKLQKIAPVDCLETCSVSGAKVLRHLLVKSESSGRMALPEYSIVCTLTGKKILKDESEKSDITGQMVMSSALKKSAFSGKKAEPQYFRTCEFSSSEILESESGISQVSGKIYRTDESLRSVISGKTGHKDEFIHCAVTGQPLLLEESQRCEATGKIVIPELIETCDVSHKKVLETELEKSVVSGKKALRNYFVLSSISGAQLLEQEAVRSIKGEYCLPAEARMCGWSEQLFHPYDLRACYLTGVQIHSTYCTLELPSRLEPLVNLLDGTIRSVDKNEMWETINLSLNKILKKGEGEIETAALSPNNKQLALCIKIKSWAGLKTRYGGVIYSVTKNEFIGRIVIGKRDQSSWNAE